MRRRPGFCKVAVSGLTAALLVTGLGSAVALAAGTPASLTAGQKLAPGQSLRSPSGRYQLTMQTDGNLVERGPNRLVWNSGTGVAGSYLTFQPDGNAVIYSPAGAAQWNTRTGGSASTRFGIEDSSQLAVYKGSTRTWLAVGSTLRTGEQLAAGETLYSPNARDRLVMQSDGNLVLYSPSRMIWNSHTPNHPNSRLSLQTDGNLVLYSAQNKPLYQSRTHSSSQLALTLGNDAFAVLRNGAGAPAWATTDTTLSGAQTLIAGDSLLSANRGYKLSMQADGNLVLYGPHGAVWNTATARHAGARAVMQADGNLVVYSAKNAALFNSETAGHSNAALTVQDDGNAVVLVGSAPVWSVSYGSHASAVAVNAAYASARARGERAAVAVYDRQAHRFYVAGDVDSYYASASVMKVFIATKLLVSGQSRSASVSNLMWRMITLSDDDAANQLYGLAGGAGVASWAAGRYRISGVANTPQSNYWGLTRITARAMTKYYNAVAADPAVGPWLLNAMANMHAPAADGWPQGFGLPAVTSGWRVKQGWMCCLDNLTRMHSTGFVNHDRYTVALLTEGSTGAYGAYGRDTVTAMAAKLLPGGQLPR